MNVQPLNRTLLPAVFRPFTPLAPTPTVRPEISDQVSLQIQVPLPEKTPEETPVVPAKPSLSTTSPPATLTMEAQPTTQDDCNDLMARSIQALLKSGAPELRTDVPAATAALDENGRSYPFSFADGRKLTVVVDPSLEEEQAKRAAQMCAEGVEHAPHASHQPARLFDGLEKVYLLPSLGIGQAGGLWCGESSQTVAGGVAVGLDMVANSDDAFNAIACALQSPNDNGMRTMKPQSRLTQSKMAADAWPANTQIFAGSRQGETLPTYATWLSSAANKVSEAGSFPAALAALDGKSLVQGDDDNLSKTYHPIGSTNLGPGWVVGDSRPRVALIFRGKMQAGEPNDVASSKERNETVNALLKNYPNLKVIELDQPTPDQVEQGLKSMQSFALENPGAESLVLYLGHGHNNRDADISNPQTALNGSLEGGLTLNGGELSETTLKGWARDYLGDFQTNLITLYCCSAGSFIA